MGRGKLNRSRKSLVESASALSKQAEARTTNQNRDVPKLVLIDGHALAYRAYHALPLTLSTSQGELTNAVFGFASMLLNVWRDEKPDYIAVTFDKGPTFRHKEYKAYKAHRAKAPDEMVSQLSRIVELVEALNIPIFAVEGYEADDVLGTLAKQAAETGLETLIVTGDTDAFQLIDAHTKVLTSRRKFSDTVIYDEKGIKERFGLEPRQLIDYKGLVGDTSDNIPGVRGIGQKTATRLLRKYGSLENIYEHLDEISGERFRRALAENRDQAVLSKYLATIVTEVPITLDLEACQAGDYDREQVMALFRELEFRSLVGRLPESVRRAASQQLTLFSKGAPRAPKPRPPLQLGRYHIIDTEAAFDELLSALGAAEGFAFDVETTSTDPMVADLVGIAFALKEGEAYYIPVGHKPHTRSQMLEASPDRKQASLPQLPLDLVLSKARPLLENEALPKYAHNGKYDIAVLAHHGIRVEGLAFDTMIAEWLIDPASHNLGLKNLAWARLEVEMTPITDLIGKGKTQISMAQVAIEEVASYAGADVDMTYRLVKLLEPELREKALWSLFAEVEMPLVPVLAEMEMTGVTLDTDFLEAMSGLLQERLTTLEQGIQDEVGYAFNVSSTQQLSDALFRGLGLPTQGLRKTKSGHYSTSASVLEGLRGQHPVIDLILEHRQLAKLRSTYVDALPKLVNPRAGKVHTSYNQTGTVTGRLSSSEPNLQNIPIRTELGRQVRRAFVAGEGCALLAADYSQVELRILAHISQDPSLLEAFWRGEDIHASTAAAIYNVPLESVTPDMRRVAKTTNFAVSYGVSGFGLAQQTGLTQEEATQFIKTYFATYPRVRRYVDETKRQAAKQGYVETLLGRRRYFPQLAARGKAHATVRQAAERAAINFPVQGTAADIIKIAMINLDKALKERGLRSKMILQVHDELVLEVPREEVDEVTSLVKEVMEGAFQLDAALKVDVKVGENWLEMEEVE